MKRNPRLKRRTLRQIVVQKQHEKRNRAVIKADVEVTTLIAMLPGPWRPIP
jgi:hypothetical protein